MGMTVGELRYLLATNPGWDNEMEVMIEREDDVSTIQAWGTVQLAGDDRNLGTGTVLVFSPADDSYAVDPYSEG